MAAASAFAAGASNGLRPLCLDAIWGIRLFVERAAAIKGDFVLTDSNAAAVVQICEHLDGIPLAIEFAAARAKIMAVAQIAGRLSDRLTCSRRAAGWLQVDSKPCAPRWNGVTTCYPTRSVVVAQAFRLCERLDSGSG